MRIVIEIDPPGPVGEGAPLVPMTVGGTGGTEASPSTAAINLADVRAGIIGADPMSHDAGVAASLPAAVTAEPPNELLARAAELNANDAGPAPGFTTPSLARTEATQADSTAVVSVLGNDASPLSPCSLSTMQEGGITNGGHAPK